MASGGGNAEWTNVTIFMCLAIAFLMPFVTSIFLPNQFNEDDVNNLFDDYYEMTGQQAQTKTAIWPLVGIYTPVIEGESSLTTPDGWMAGSIIREYSPSQFQGTPESYTVYQDDNGIYRYRYNSADYNEQTGTGHRGTWQWDETTNQYVKSDTPGDIYSAVAFDMQHTSNIFFTESQRTMMGDNFYFNFSGYRYSFSPISDYTTLDQNGDRVPVIATSTSLSLVFYQWYSQSGISGQIILSGSGPDGGVAYINSANILSAFNSVTNSASFEMVFNGGITMNITVRLSPTFLSTYSVQDAFNLGYWSVMVTSLSADANAYVGTDNALNPMKVLDVAAKLFTFDWSGYNLSDSVSMLVTVLFSMFLYAGLITLCLEYNYLWILVGILAAVQSLTSLGGLLG